MFDVVAFGEMLLRLSPPGYQKIIQANTLEMNFGGAEANVAIALSNLGIKTAYFTIVPDNALGQAAINHLRKFGVNTDYIKKKGKRLGLYFLEKGVGQRASSVIYDRADSAIYSLQKSDFNLDEILSNTKILFFSGITAALSENILEYIIDICKTAKKHNVKIAFDINHRTKLWDYEKANERISKFIEYIDILITNEEHVRKVFKIAINEEYVNGIDLTEDGQMQLYEKIEKKFPNLEKIILAARRSLSASKNIFYAYTKEDNEFIFSSKRNVEIIDRVGGGDAFTAGILYGLLNGYNTKHTLEFATAMCLLKHTLEGDATVVSLEDIKNVILLDGEAMMQR
ncbi:sugar kinase [Caldicellulosiruptoraceae bacterium PP1]